MPPHIVASFEAELRQLANLVVDMGQLVARQVDKGNAALQTGDKALAQEAIDLDRLVDRRQLQIEEMAVNLIAKRQPVAIDLREVVSTLKLATDLERMGDHAKNNAKRVLAMNPGPFPGGIGANLSAMVGRIHAQIAKVVQAYAERDPEAAEAVWHEDREIDQLYDALFRELLTYMMEDPRSIGFCTHLLFCAKNIERMGDHATNIAETVNYIATGRYLSGDRQSLSAPAGTT